MGAKIQDEFALSGMARQQVYSLRRKRDGFCIRCGTRPRVNASHCEPCRVKSNANVRDWLRRQRESRHGR